MSTVCFKFTVSLKNVAKGVLRVKSPLTGHAGNWRFIVFGEVHKIFVPRSYKTVQNKVQNIILNNFEIKYQTWRYWCIADLSTT